MAFSLDRLCTCDSPLPFTALSLTPTGPVAAVGVSDIVSFPTAVSAPAGAAAPEEVEEGCGAVSA